MDGHNEVFLQGTLGQDPELVTINKKDGTTISKVTMNMATNRSYQQNGEWKQETMWHKIEVWGGQADYVSKNLKKGHDLTVVGELRYDQWEDKDSGAKREKAVIHARRVIAHDNRAKGQAPAQNAAQQPQGQQQQPQGQQKQQPQGQPQNAAQNVQQYANQTANEGVSYGNQNFPDTDGEDDLPF